MNVIFTIITVCSALILLLKSPNEFLSAMLDGGKGAIDVATSLFAVYAVWLSFSKICEKTQINRGLAKAIKPVCVKIFKTDDEKTTQYLAMNLTCNLLGVGGAATPYGVKACENLTKQNNVYAQKLLFVLNATSLQILPTTVIAIRASANSLNPADIFLPTLLSTATCTLLSVALFLGVNKLCRS